MARISTLLFCLLVLAPAQAAAGKFAFGPLQFDAGADGIVVIYHGHEWKPDLSKPFLHPGDCQIIAARDACGTQPGIACIACITDWQPLAWDALNEILYLAASTSPRENPQGVVLAYDLRNDQLNRVMNYNEKYDANGAVSPDGRYLILVASMACGKCCTSSHLVAIDTQSRISATFPLPGIAALESAQITAVRWTGSSLAEYSVEIRHAPDCSTDAANPPRKNTGTLDVPSFLKQQRNSNQ